jgi:hypothetical protein
MKKHKQTTLLLLGCACLFALCLAATAPFLIERTRSNAEYEALAIRTDQYLSDRDQAITTGMATFWAEKGNPLAELGWILAGVTQEDVQSKRMLEQWKAKHGTQTSGVGPSPFEPFVEPQNFQPMPGVNSPEFKDLSPFQLASEFIEREYIPGAEVQLAQFAQAADTTTSSSLAGMGWRMVGIYRGQMDCIKHVNDWIDGRAERALKQSPFPWSR